MEPLKPTAIFETTDKKTKDGFANFVAKIGVAPQGTPAASMNMLSQGEYVFNLVTRNRVQLEAAYRGSWIVGRVIDCVANDMTRSGIDITTNEDPESVLEIQREWKRLKIWSATRSTIKWGDLYGGALAVVQIEGQKISEPLDPETINEGDFKGLIVYDRWQVYPVLDKIINEGPDMGLPEYYDIVLGANLNDPAQEPGGQITENANGRVRVHHTRCLRMIGIELPFWQAITEMLWGESKLERMWDRLLEFDDVTASAGNLVNRAYLRMVGVESLREILAAGGIAQENLIKQFAMMSELQKNEGVTLLDKTDEYKADTYTFAGLSDIMLQFAQQVSGAAEIPLIILFGQSPSGMNSTGDSDIRTYYDSINSKQEASLRNFFEILLKITYRSLKGKPAPDDLAFEFTPLWQMSAIDKATIAKTNTDTIIEAHEAGLVDSSTAMKELKHSSGDTGLFTHISDEAVEEAENEEPPEPESVVSQGGVGTPGEGPETPKTKDSAWNKIKRWLSRDKVEAPKIRRMTSDQKRIQDYLNEKT